MRDRHSVDKNITKASLFLTSFEIHQKDRVVDKIKSKRDVIFTALNKSISSCRSRKSFSNCEYICQRPKKFEPQSIRRLTK